MMQTDDRESQRVAAQLNDDVRQIQALLPLAPQITQAAALLRGALANQRLISIGGNRTSGVLAAAAGLDYGVFLPPGRAGDLILLVLADPPSDDIKGVIAAARGRGIQIVALLSKAALPLAQTTDAVLTIPGDDLGTFRLLSIAVLRAIRLLLEPFPC